MFQQKNSSFCDLNIPIGPNTRQICERAIELGFRVLAINTPVIAKDYLAQQNGAKKGGKKRKLEERTGGTLAVAAASTTTTMASQQIGIPLPPPYDWINKLITQNEGLKILHRLTVIFNDVNEFQAVLNHNNSSKYDILAGIPTNHEALHGCIISTTLIFDIISFDFEGPYWINKIMMKRQKGILAGDKEIFFEVSYAASFHGDAPLENMLYTAHRLTEDICTRRMKNIIITSGAAKPSELRTPKDILGIGFLLDLDETTTRICMREHCNRLVSKADLRKHGKTWVAFIPESGSDSIPDSKMDQDQKG